MLVDLPGRVRNTKLPLTRPLLPLFDAVVNSIHAVEESGREDGRIEVTIVRDGSQSQLPDAPLQPLIGFEVHDNGVGFTEENFRSFQTSDTTQKLAKGGKGIGRFLWLKAFDKTRISSTFLDGPTLRRRSFDFVLVDEGVVNLEIQSAPDATGTGTTVRLEGLKVQYRKHCPLGPEIIARKLIQHCMAYFLSPAPPQVILVDNNLRLSLNQLFDEQISNTAQTRNFSIKGEHFRAVHLRLYSSDEPRHQAHYCAHNREVYEENLASSIPDLHKRLMDESGEHFFLATYISGAILDATVNNERTDFVFADVDLDLFPEEITKSELHDGVVREVRSLLAPYLEAIEKEKIDRIESFVQQKAPQYRPLLKHGRNHLSSIPANVTDDGLDLELHRVKLRYLTDLKKEGMTYLAPDSKTMFEDGEIRERYRQFAAQLSELLKSELAEYIVHRRFVLDLLQRALEVRESGRYALEENVHELIFPLRTTSDDVDYERQNLWIIDEKLSYHRYLASDRPLSSLEPIASEGRERPDLIVFNSGPFALVEEERPFGSIVIIEFKRPLRDDYNDDKNPISQIYGYIKRIREGRAIDRAGRPVAVAQNTPFYCYVLCDLTVKMREFAETANLTPTPDGLGFFGYNATHGAYVEVVSYDKVVADARKRNQVLFDKLCLPG